MKIMYRVISIMMSLFLLFMAIPGFASTTVWAINDAAQPVSASYDGTDWIGRISFGQSFELLEEKGDYVKLRNLNGKTGWTARENIAYYDPCDLHLEMHVQADGDILWPQADFEDEPVSLHKGDIVTAIGITPWKVWYLVLFRNNLYYVPCQLLAEVPAQEEGRSLIAEQRYVFGSGVDLHRTPEKKADDFITYIDDGSMVQLLSVANNEDEGLMAEVCTEDGQIGYVHLVNLVLPEQP